MWDYESAYPGGPMVAVLGFPRQLYPPDAKGYTPSIDGPDVEGYKRTVSRAGRWEWQAFDQQFSNVFSHGKNGGNVGESGIAGIQRQQRMDATGYVGQQTFNTLRSIRIPPGLPHAGEMAMDARSVELINAAYNHFKQPEKPNGKSSEARLKKAVSQIGTKENPPNSNQCKYTSWYGMIGPWCAMFVSWCDQMSSQPTDSFKAGYAYAYVPYVVNDARLCVNGLSITSTPKAGDLVCYDWSWDGEHDHIGLVEMPPDAAGNFVAIEGNTSLSNNSNGGEVMRRDRNIYNQKTVFVRVSE